MLLCLRGVPLRICRISWPAAIAIAVVEIGFLFTANCYAGGQASARQLFEEAQAARARGDWGQAEQKYREVIEREPQLASAYHNLGIVYFSERKYHDAISVLAKALKIDPQLEGACVILGLSYYQLSEPEKAVAAFQKALHLKPADGNALLYLAKAQVQSRDYRAAADNLEKLAQQRPRDPEVYYNLSLSYMKLMLENLNRLGEVAPRSFEAWLLLAQDADARGDDEAAIKNYRAALAIRPEALGIHYALGSAYAHASKYDAAAQEFKQELQLNPNDSLALWKLSEFTLPTNPQEALGYAKRAAELNPELPQAVLAYGRALLQTGETEKAIEQFRRVIRLAPEEDSAHYLLANAARRLGREEEAKAELARFQELAQKKSRERLEYSKQLIDLTRQTQNAVPQIEPGFDPSRNPVHP